MATQGKTRLIIVPGHGVRKKGFSSPDVAPLDSSWSESSQGSIVLLSGCDKTTPAMLMGTASADVPTIMVTGRPMLQGVWRQAELGSGTDLGRAQPLAFRRSPDD